MRADDLFTEITEHLIAEIESGAAGDWRMPWHTLADAGTPTSVDGRTYRGMNALWLPMVAAAHGWSSGLWATYRGWQRHGAQVRRGEKATQVVLWKPTNPTDTSSGPDDEQTHCAARDVHEVVPAVHVQDAEDGLPLDERVVAYREARLVEEAQDPGRDQHDTEDQRVQLGGRAFRHLTTSV